MLMGDMRQIVDRATEANRQDIVPIKKILTFDSCSEFGKVYKNTLKCKAYVHMLKIMTYGRASHLLSMHYHQYIFHKVLVDHIDLDHTEG